MASIKMDMFSDNLLQTVSVDIYLPYDREDYKAEGADAVIYLLHGMKGTSSSWFNLTAAQRYARENNLVLICPQAHNSFYADNYFGENYFTFISEELPKKLHKLYNFPKEREKTFIAGLSMGGYGAMLLGLGRPDLFAACATFSGAVGITQTEYINKDDPFAKRYLRPILGMDYKQRQELDVAYLAKKISELSKEKQPRILSTCGTEDFLYKPNIAFKNYMQTLPVDFTYMEWPGEHDWYFWDKSLILAIDFFLNNGCAKKCFDQWRSEPSVETNKN